MMDFNTIASNALSKVSPGLIESILAAGESTAESTLNPYDDLLVLILRWYFTHFVAGRE